MVLHAITRCLIILCKGQNNSVEKANIYVYSCFTLFTRTCTDGSGFACCGTSIKWNSKFRYGKMVYSYSNGFSHGFFVQKAA